MVEINDLAGVGKIMDTQLALEIYQDTFKPWLRIFGDTGYIVGFPFGIVATKCRNIIKRIENDTPQDSRVVIHPSMLGPVIREMLIHDPNSYIHEMYMRILLGATNKDTAEDSMPCFVYFVQQLNQDESVFLQFLFNQGKLGIEEKIEFFDFGHKSRLNLSNHDDVVPLNKMIYPDNFSLNFEHLRNLGIVEWNITKNATVSSSKFTDKDSVVIARKLSVMSLTPLGQKFVEICIGDINIV